MSWEFFGVLLPHFASILYESLVSGTVILGKAHLTFNENHASDIANIARDDGRKSAEAIASYTRHFRFPEFIREYSSQSKLLILLNCSNMLGVYFEEVKGKIVDHPSVWISPLAMVLVAVALGGFALYVWNRMRSTLPFRKQVQAALCISHITTLIVLIVTAYGSGAIWRLAHP